MQGIPMGNDGLFQKSLYGWTAEKTGCRRLWRQAPAIGSGLPENREKPALPPEIPMDA